MSIKNPIDIERLVTWALRDQGLGWTGGGQGGDSLAGLAELGTRVDRSNQGGGLPPPGIGLCDNDDALAVRRAIDLLPAEARALVVLHGRIATRPEFGEEGYGKPAQLMNKRDQPMWLYRDPKNRRGKIGPALDWRAYDHHVAQIDYERAQWTAWREALVALRLVLVKEGALAEHQPTGPIVPAQPWKGIPDDGPVDIPYGQTLAARRAAAQAPIRPENVTWRYGDEQSTEGGEAKSPEKQGAGQGRGRSSTAAR